MNKVLITGGTGLIGASIEKIVPKDQLNNYLFLSSKECDLTSFEETTKLFEKEKPTHVIHLAACVGGLFKNLNYKVEMLEKNLLINFNVLKACFNFNVKKCISCLSTCVFPDDVTYPINENMLHMGAPHDSNYGYAYAKRMLEIHSRVYQEQFNKDFICIIPTNIYGWNDNYHLEDAHVIPALIHKCYLAKKNKEMFIVKGTGKPLRQFIYSDDLAKLILFTLKDYNDKTSIILSTGEEDEISIKDVATIIAKEFSYENYLTFDISFSDGQYKKTADNTKIKKLYQEKTGEGFKFTTIEDGLKETIRYFINNYNLCRK